MISKEDYNIKYAISCLSNDNEKEDKEIWKKLWTKGFIPKITFFIWILTHNKLQISINNNKHIEKVDHT